jgi:serine/threonine protein phosphatase PrpC
LNEVRRVAVLGSTVEENYITPPESSGFKWAQLAVTRSLGHNYFEKYGIIPDPHISPYTLNKADKYLILCSDGVTDVLSGKDIVEAVSWFDHNCVGSMEEVSKELVKYSLRNWDDEADNTTAIVVKLT